MEPNLNNQTSSINSIFDFDNYSNENENVLGFLNNAVNKSKNLNHNKLQIKLQECIEEIKKYKQENESLKYIIDELKKGRDNDVQIIEKYKTQVQKYIYDHEEFNRLLEHSKNLINHEKNVNHNLKTVYEAQIHKLKDENQNLNIKTDDHIKDKNELLFKHDEIFKRYKDLTILYSVQTNELELCKKELKHLNDELNTSRHNHKTLHNEIHSIKQETSEHLSTIEELKRLNALQIPITTLSKKQIPPPSIQKPASKVTSTRGLKVTNR